VNKKKIKVYYLKIKTFNVFLNLKSNFVKLKKNILNSKILKIKYILFFYLNSIIKIHFECLKI